MPLRDGDFYINNSNQDFYLRENGAWVRKGNIRDEGSSGLVGVAPVVGIGFSLEAAVQRIRYLGSTAFSLGLDQTSAVQRIRLLAASMDVGLSQTSNVQRIRLLNPDFTLGFDVTVVVSEEATSEEDIIASFGLGVSMTATLTKARMLSAAFDIGFSESAVLGRTRLLSAAMDLGLDQGSVLSHDSLELYTAVVDLSSTTPGLWFFSGLTQGTKYSNPTNPPATTGGVKEVVFNSDGTELATVSGVNANSVSIYSTTSDPLVRSAVFSLPTTRKATGVDWSGRYLAVALDMSPGFAVYDEDNAWAKLTDPASVPSSFSRGVRFNAEGTRLAVVDSGAGTIRIYSVSGTTLTLTNTLTYSDVSTSPIISIKFSDDGTVLVVGLASTSIPFITWSVTSSGTVFTRDTIVSTPGVDTQDICINPAKTFIAIASQTSPYLAIYNYPAMTKVTNPASMPTSLANGCTFTPDGSELLLTGNFSGAIQGYTVSSWTKFTRSLTMNNPGWRIRTIMR